MSKLLTRLIALEARVDEAIDLAIGGLRKLARVIPGHLDKRGITAVTVASAYTPSHSILPGKGLKVDGLRAVRQQYQPGMLKSRRKLQFVDDATGTQATITRPRKRTWEIESLSNASTPGTASQAGLKKAYERYGFETNHARIRQALRAMPSMPPRARVTDEKVMEHAGGLPMIRRPRRGASSSSAQP